MDATATHECQPAGCEDTRERILLASQKLFADKGFDATSVRDITTEAGCNVASVNYHFGGKDKLYLETFRSMLTVLRDRRLELMGELMERQPTPSLEEFVFFEPMMERAAAGLSRGGPPLDTVSARLCVMSLVGQLLHSLKAHHLLADLGRPDVLPTQHSDQIAHFVRFSVGGIRACGQPKAVEKPDEIASEVNS
jgi:AcrR family transcriptional regulator